VKVFGTNTRTIPTIDLSCEDYGLVYRLAQNNQGPVVRVAAESEDLGEVPAHNVIGTIRGTEKPNDAARSRTTELTAGSSHEIMLVFRPAANFEHHHPPDGLSGGDMRMKRLHQVAVGVWVVSVMACSSDGSDISAVGVDAISAVIVPGAGVRPIALNHQALTPLWTVSKDQEISCGAPASAGGDVGGKASFTHLGQSWVEVSAAWDVANLLTTPAQYQPVGPAGGPVAPVIGQSGYPHAFSYDPESGTCQQTVAATGKVVLTAANGDRLLGDITGGEAHRLDFLINGDGVETFAAVEVTGGTGRFADATGSFVVHTIARITPTLRFKITLAEIMPGGTIGF
jgi:hypothetical protein